VRFSPDFYAKTGGFTAALWSVKSPKDMAVLLIL